MLSPNPQPVPGTAGKLMLSAGNGQLSAATIASTQGDDLRGVNAIVMTSGHVTPPAIVLNGASIYLNVGLTLTMLCDATNLVINCPLLFASTPVGTLPTPGTPGRVMWAADATYGGVTRGALVTDNGTNWVTGDGQPVTT